MKNKPHIESCTSIPPLGVRGLKKLKRRIRQCEAEIATINSLPYYTLFNRESERAADRALVERKLAVFSDQYSVAVGSGLTPSPSPKERGAASLGCKQ